MTESLDEGYRAIALDGHTHDVDETAHTVTVDFPFERMDAYRSDFGVGWCDDYLKTHKPVMVVHHNPRDLIGRATSYQNLGDRAQLVGKFSDFDSVPLAKEYFAHIRDDEIPGWSYHYRNARGIPHPSGVRSAVRYTKGDMPEFGPTPFPAIPGAGAVGLRSEEHTLTIPSIAEILQLKKDGFVDDEGVRSLIAEHHPNMREYITIGDGVKIPQASLDAITDAVHAAYGNRAITLSVDDEGSVTETDGGGVRATDEDSATLAVAVDACLDEIEGLVDGIDLSTLPAPVQQALELASAGGRAIDELLTVMGVEDNAHGDRALLGAKERNDLPDSDFAYIEPGGTKDDDGKTMPRSKRHFPIQDADHVRNALSRIGAGAEFGDQAKAKVEAAAKKFKVDTEGNRSVEDETSEQSTAASEALARLRTVAA